MPRGPASKEELELLGASLAKAYVAPELGCFDELLKAVDEADGEMARSRHKSTRNS